MEIKILYEENMKNGHRNYTTIKIPDGDYDLMIQLDYQKRLAEAPAAKKDAVKKCDTVQEVFDLMNKREYNGWHRETRHIDLTPKARKLNGSKGYIASEEDDKTFNVMDYLATCNPYNELDQDEEDEKVLDVIRTNFNSQTADLIIAVYINKETPEEYASVHNLKRDTVYKRLQRAKETLKKLL